MEADILYHTIGLVVFAAAFLIFIVVRKQRTNKKNSIDVSEITTLFDKNNVFNLEYIRNKIVVSFNDISLFNVEELHSKSVKGINVVGDKIKFYVSDNDEINESIYKAIKAFIEG